MKFDLLGPPQPFYINSHSRFTTYIGLICTVLMVILSILCIVGFGKDIIFKESPSVLVSRKYENYPVDSEPFLFAIFMHYPGGIPLENPERQFQFHLDIFDYDNGRDKKLNFTSVELTSCKNNYLFQQNYNNITNSLINDAKYYYCNKDNTVPVLSGKFGSKKFTLIQIVISKCNNKTSNNSCLPNSELAIVKNYVSVHLVYPDSFIESYSYNNPVKFTYNTIISPLSDKLERSDHFEHKLVDFYSDSGIILEDKSYTPSSQLNSYYVDFKIKKEVLLYYKAYFTLSHYKDIYSRNYLKLQDIAAKSGGFIKAIMLVLTLFLYFVNQPMIVDYLMKKNVSKFEKKLKRYKGNKKAFEVNNYTMEIENTTVLEFTKDKFINYISKTSPMNRLTENKVSICKNLFCFCKKDNDRIRRNYEKYLTKTLSVENILNLDTKINQVMKALFSETTCVPVMLNAANIHFTKILDQTENLDKQTIEIMQIIKESNITELEKGLLQGVFR